MKNRTSNHINKEKLVFAGVALMLAGCFYYLLTSQPAALEPGTMVSPLAPPGPVAAEKPAKGIANVTGLLNAADRANPFQPVMQKTEVGVPGPRTYPNGTQITVCPMPIPVPPPQNDDPENATGHAGRNPDGIVDHLAAVAFSAVVMMNGQTYGLVKAKDGRTFQLKVGDYLDEFKYTVTRIDKRAIWMTDEKGRVFVARDMFVGQETADRQLF